MSVWRTLGHRPDQFHERCVMELVPFSPETERIAEFGRLSTAPTYLAVAHFDLVSPQMQRHRSRRSNERCF